MTVGEFDTDYFARLAAARDHWWVRGMQDAAEALLGPATGELRVLDAGCGTGANLLWAADLTRTRPLHGADLVPEAVGVARRATGDVAELVTASTTALPYADASFDLVLSVDVLQHLPDAAATQALQELTRVLAPGGRLLVRTNAAFGRRHVPQREDWRLYSPATLTAALQAAGLRVERLTSANALHSLWASAPRLPRRHDHHHEHGTPDRHQTAADTGHRGLGIPRPVSPSRNAVLRRLLRVEARWLRHRDLPFGHSLLAVARKQQGQDAG